MERNEILQAIQELSVKERMELLSEAAKENDATVVLGNGNELVKAAKASRAVGSVQNTTSNYGLPLPTAGEVMAYQDFINTPMGIIDNAMKENADNISLNSQGLAQANVNISAADTKINNIQTNLNEWNVPGIIQEQQSMDARLEAVEETTMEFVNPDVGLKITDSGGHVRELIRTGGMMFFERLTINTNTSSKQTITTITNYFTGETTGPVTVNMVGTIPGNPFNGVVNTYYIATDVNINVFENNSYYVISNSSIIFMYNGSVTNIYVVNKGKMDNANAYLSAGSFIPLGLL